VNLLGYLQRPSNISPVSLPEPTASSDLKEVVQTVERLEGKIDALKESVDSLERRVRVLETTCRARAEPSKRRRDDRPPEASSVGGSGNLQGTVTESSTVPPQIEEAAVTSTVGRELVLYVNPDTLPLSIVQLCTDEEAREIINIADYISDDDEKPLHKMFYSVKKKKKRLIL